MTFQSLTKLRPVFFGTILSCIAFTGLASANLLEVKKSVEEAICKKLATDYANDSKSFTVQSIAQLQICLAQSLKDTATTTIPRNFEIQSPRQSTNNVDTTLPTPPTPPTPPSAIKIR
ncbi:MAG: hypothetical protein WD032_02460 [Nitrospirales bacterium]